MVNSEVFPGLTPLIWDLGGEHLSSSFIVSVANLNLSAMGAQKMPWIIHNM